MPFLSAGRLLIGTIIIALLGVGGSMLVDTSADMRVEPTRGTYGVDETFTIDIVVESKQPVNVFKGELHFDPDILWVESIDYNTSIADLWAKRPWYENGEGTLNFIGGTTRPGGFIGTGELITVTFRTKALGDATVGMRDVRILQHDGLGSETTVADPIDSIFTIEPKLLEAETILMKNDTNNTVHVREEVPSTDLNGDGKQSIADVSIFMRDLMTGNTRSDLNQDGSVNNVDLSILLDAQ